MHLFGRPFITRDTHENIRRVWRTAATADLGWLVRPPLSRRRLFVLRWWPPRL